MDKITKLEAALEKFNGRLEVISHEKKKAVVRADYFTKIKAKIDQIRTDLHALGQVLDATNDVVGNISKDLSTLDKSDKIEAAWQKSLNESDVKLQKLVEKLAQSIPADNTSKILESIAKIKMPVIPEYPKFPEIKIPSVPKVEFPDIPEPVRRWTFDILRDDSGKIVEVIANSG